MKTSYARWSRRLRKSRRLRSKCTSKSVLLSGGMIAGVGVGGIKMGGELINRTNAVPEINSRHVAPAAIRPNVSNVVHTMSGLMAKL